MSGEVIEALQGSEASLEERGASLISLNHAVIVIIASMRKDRCFLSVDNEMN